MSCPKSGLVDRHFARGSGELFAHLPECADCRERYKRRLLVEKLDPRGEGPKARLRRALGLPAPGRPWALWVGAPAAALAAAALLVMLSPSGFVARGGAKPDALEIYRARNGKAARVDGQIGVGDELAFAYRNPAKKPRLLIFAVDEHQHVFWYHPAWVKAADEPVAIAVAADAALHELPESIAQPLDGKELRVTAWFLDEPLSVKRAEALVVKGRAPAGAVVVERVFVVDR
jgi:hypothetical protein